MSTNTAAQGTGAPGRIEQNTIKRRGTGLRGHDRARAEMPYAVGLTAFLTDRGTLFYNGNVPKPTTATYIGGVVMEVDWKGRVLWELKHPDHHHDGIRLRNGNVLLAPTATPPKRSTGRRPRESDMLPRGYR